MDDNKSTGSKEGELKVEADKSGSSFIANIRTDISKKEDKETDIELRVESDAPWSSNLTMEETDHADSHSSIRNTLREGHVEEPIPLPPGGLQRQNHMDALAGVPGAHPVGNPMHGQALQRMNPEGRAESETITIAGDETHISAHLVNDTDDNQVFCDGMIHRPSITTESTTPLEVFEGRVMTGTNHRRDTKRWSLLLLLAFLAFTIMLVLLLNKPTDKGGLRVVPSKTNPTQSNEQSPDHPFQDDLPVAVLNLIQDNVGGPLWKANRWLLDDPNFHDYSPERLRQRFYVALVYYATNGDTTWIQNDHWLSYNVSECQWFSSSSFDMDSKYYFDHICEENSTVINLSLANNNLTGSLPIYYTDFLPTLKVFDIGGNYIGEPFPVIISTPYLEVFIISHNLFGGSFIFDAGVYFPNVKVVRLDWTTPKGNYQGALPYIVPKLEVWNLTGQYSDGDVWSSLGLLTNLEYLSYTYREMTYGTIPSELGNLTALKELNLAHVPKLAGTIPSELGRLTQLTKMDITRTSISGQVPNEVCQLITDGVLKLQADCDGNFLVCCGSE